MAVSATPKVSEFELAIRDEVRAWMGRRGLTGRDIAKILGIAQPNVSKKLNGVNAFSINDLGTIAGALGITLGDLLGGVARSPIIVPDTENPAPVSPERGEEVRPVGLEPTTHGLKVPIYSQIALTTFLAQRILNMVYKDPNEQGNDL